MARGKYFADCACPLETDVDIEPVGTSHEEGLVSCVVPLAFGEFLGWEIARRELLGNPQTPFGEVVDLEFDKVLDSDFDFAFWGQISDPEF